MFNQRCHWAHTRLSQTTQFQWLLCVSVCVYVSVFMSVYVTSLEANILSEMS